MNRLAFLRAIAIAPVAAQSQMQAQMNEKARADHRRADAALNRPWRATYALMKQRDAAVPSRGGCFGFVASLLVSQRAGLRYRDAECVIESGKFAGGSVRPMSQAGCLTRLTTACTAQLKVMEWQR